MTLQATKRPIEARSCQCTSVTLSVFVLSQRSFEVSTRYLRPNDEVLWLLADRKVHGEVVCDQVRFLTEFNLFSTDFDLFPTDFVLFSTDFDLFSNQCHPHVPTPDHVGT